MFLRSIRLIITHFLEIQRICISNEALIKQIQMEILDNSLSSLTKILNSAAQESSSTKYLLINSNTLYYI